MSGGYRYVGKKPRIHGPVNMIKTTSHEGLARMEEVLDAQGMAGEIIMGAVDTLQATPFRINKNIYAVMDVIRQNEKYDYYKLPNLREPTPTTPYFEKKRWWEVGHAQATMFLTQLIEAEKNLSMPMLFYPHTFDFRGRLYPMGGVLNPQSTKEGRALLEFAEGRRMGEHPDAGKWLAIHGANCWGNSIDKASISDRVEWIRDNTDLILQAASAPLDFHWWLEADEPWLFLAFCFEWAGYTRDGADHLTHLPVHVDGACNGSQHMAALMRCKETGRLVGLCASTEDERPEDLYEEVAKEVARQIDIDAAEGDPDALRIQKILATKPGRDDPTPKKPFGINRRLAKSPVMTYGYGITDRGMKEGIADNLFEWKRDKDITKAQWAILCPTRDPEEKKREGAGPFWKTVTYLAEAFEKAIEKKAKAAGKVMNWLKDAAHILAATEAETKDGKKTRKGCPVAWTTPVGSPVYFEKYRNTQVKPLRVKLWENATADRKKQSIQISRKYNTGKIDLGKMKRGVPPDVIHSLDAAHMMLTIEYCQRCGIRSFAMIHDSYGTHATTMPIMANKLRQAFLDIYIRLSTSIG